MALDARTGELKWVYAMDEGRRAEIAPRKLSGRGLSYWTDGKGDDRIVFVTIGYRLVELNAKTGQPVPSFGKGGVIDLKEGVVFGKDGKQVQIPLETGEIGTHSTPLVVNDVIVVQSAMAEGLRYEFSTNNKGLVRAYDARTRQAALALQHDAGARRVRPRDVGERIVGLYREHRRLDGDVGRSGSRPAVPAG